MSVFCHHWRPSENIASNSWSKRNSTREDEGLLSWAIADRMFTRIASDDFDEKKREEFDAKFARVPKDRIWHPNMDNVGILSMHYSILRADLLRREFEREVGAEFDCVFRARFDAFVPNEFCIEKYDLDRVNIPSRELDFGGINDRLAFGNSKLMAIYSSAYLDLPELAIEHGYQGECVLLGHLTKNRVPIIRPEPDFPAVL